MKNPKRIVLANEASVYHCISRIVSGQKRLDAAAKEILRRQLWRVADFSGVELLSYCLMSNHWHILLRIPPPGPLSNGEIARRWAVLYQEDADEQQAFERFLDSGQPQALDQKRRLLARMGHLSQFFKTLKQRFTFWFNKSRSHFGTIWAERCKSLLVENNPYCLKVIAAYLALNPVRAGLCRDPQNYRWSIHGEAAAGNQPARQSLLKVMGLDPESGDAAWKKAWSEFRLMLYAKGSVPRQGQACLAQPEPEEAMETEEPKKTIGETLRGRVRHFTTGIAAGSIHFLSSLLPQEASRTPPHKPTRPPHSLASDGLPGMAVLRMRKERS